MYSPARLERVMGAEMTTPGEPLVSVVIPVYNAADTIGEQLDALERQAVPDDWEIVIALQPCTDDSAAVIAAHPSTRVRVVEAYDEHGASYARNIGAEAARAPLIAFCDADDIVAENWLAELLSYSSAPVVAGAIIEFDGTCDRNLIDPDTVMVPSVDLSFMLAAFSGNLLVQRDAFRAVGGFDTHFRRCEDNDLAWRLQLAGYEMSTAPSALVFYRRRGTRATQWLQSYRWARQAPTLHRRFRSHGMPRSDLGRALRGWWWLITRLPLTVRPAHRALWLQRSAERAGRLVGSIRERNIYL